MCAVSVEVDARSFGKVAKKFRNFPCDQNPPQPDTLWCASHAKASAAHACQPAYDKAPEPGERRGSERRATGRRMRTASRPKESAAYLIIWAAKRSAASDDAESATERESARERDTPPDFLATLQRTRTSVVHGWRPHQSRDSVGPQTIRTELPAERPKRVATAGRRAAPCGSTSRCEKPADERRSLVFAHIAHQAEWIRRRSATKLRRRHCARAARPTAMAGRGPFRSGLPSCVVGHQPTGHSAPESPGNHPGPSAAF